ncbi:MAG: Gfo/Idh/MocA family oxidoreductase [Pseudomonadota bacterium]
MSKDTFGICLIGTGMAASPHAEALRELSGSIDVRGVFSRNADKRLIFAERFGFPAADSIDALADDAQTHAAIIITPPNERLALIRRFAEAGKHILSEKPLERTTAAAEEIVAICEENGVKLGTVFQHRFRAASIALKTMIESDELGAIGLVRVNVPWWREQAYYDEPGRGTYERDGGGVLISQAIHTLDQMLSIAGPVSAVQAVAGTTPFHDMEAEDFVAGGLRFRSGAFGALTATTAAFPGEAESITLDCERATVHLQSGTLSIAWRNGRKETVGESAGTGGGADPMAFPHDWHRDLIAAFVEAVRSGREPVASGSETLHVHRLIDALIESSHSRMAVEINN